MSVLYVSDGFVIHFMKLMEDRFMGFSTVPCDEFVTVLASKAPVPGGGYRAFSGTSFAAPFVTGSAALLMEWGIVQGNDPYLYGEKVKAYLRRGARELPGYSEWPNSLLGFGALCVRDSLPES